MRLAVVADVGVVELQEDPLRPFEVAWIGGVHFAIPIVGKSEAFQLSAKSIDVFFRRGAGMLTRFDGILFRRQSKGIPSHRVQDVVASHALVTSDDVRGGVALWVAYVQAGTAGIGEHVQDEVLWLAGIKVRVAGIGSVKGVCRFPCILPLRLKGIEGELFASFARGGGLSAHGGGEVGLSKAKRQGRKTTSMLGCD